MENEELPSIYSLANQISLKAQQEFCIVLAVNLISLSTAVILSVFYTANLWYIYIQIFTLCLSLFCTVFLSIRSPEKFWYGGRALAESVKTISWRFITKAEPFNSKNDDSIELFIQKLKELVSTNKEITKKSVSSVHSEEITSYMSSARKKSLKDRIQIYSTGRVNDQLNWYQKKAKDNQIKLNTFLFLVVLSTLMAIGFSIGRLSSPDATQWPTDIYVSISTSLLAWIQTKRFQELSASYSQTVVEIKLIKSQLLRIKTESEFSEFVKDAENAFSREHTQWIARRDI